MIQLCKYRNGEPWDGSYVWVNRDHITFLSVSVFIGNNCEETRYTTITTVGGGQTNVKETPTQILMEMERNQKWKELMEEQRRQA